MEVTRELIRVNGLQSCYIRPLVYLGYGEMGLNPLPSKVVVVHRRLAVGHLPRGRGHRNGVQGQDQLVAAHRREHDPHGREGRGVYINSSLAKVEALKAGYDEAILLNEHGHVAEGSGENIFVVKDGVLMTPPLSEGVLRGITRETIITFAKDLDIPFTETTLLRQDLYLADEAFFTGTAAEVVPIRSPSTTGRSAPPVRSPSSCRTCSSTWSRARSPSTTTCSTTWTASRASA
jgi:branched-chain amino acid aminotransferase